MIKEINYEIIPENIYLTTDIINICIDPDELIKFKAFCFDNGIFSGKFIMKKSESALILLREIQKPERKKWLNFALKSKLIKPAEKTFKIGDVIKITFDDEVQSQKRYILNSGGNNKIILNDRDGYSLNGLLKINNPKSITEKELLVNLNDIDIKEITYVGEGVNAFNF